MSDASTSRKTKKAPPSKKTVALIPKEPQTSEENVVLTQGRARWNPVLGVALAILIFFGAQIVSGILISYYRYPRHWTNQQLINWLNNSINAQFFYILFAESIIVLLIYLFVRRYKDGLKTIGIRKPQWSDLAYGLCGLPIYLVLFLVSVAAIQHFIPSLNVNEKQQLGFNNVTGNLQLILTFLSLVVLPPIAEEILFRGLLYSSLKKNLPKIVAVLGTCTLFAIGHLPEGGSAGPLYIAGIDTFILSLVLIGIREKSGGIWGSMTLHALKNGIAFYALYVAFIR